MQKYPRRAMGLALGAVVVVLGGIVFLVVSMGLRTTENGVSGVWEGIVFVLNRDVEEDSIAVHRSELVPQANPGRNSGKSDSVTTAKTGTVELFCPVAKDETAVRTGFFLPKRVSADYVIGVGNVLHLVEPNLQISVDKNYLGWVRYGKESGNQLNYQIVYKLPDHLLKRRSEWCTWLKEKRAVVSPSEDWMALVDYEERGLVHLLKSNADDEEKQLITKPVATVELSTESIDFLDWVDDETLVSLSGGHVQFWDAGQMARSGSVDLANIGTVSGAYRGPIRLSVNRQFTVVANAHTMDLIDNESRKLHTQNQVEGIVSELTVAENLSYLAYRATETKDSVIVADLATGEQSQFRLSTSKPIELDRDGNRPELVMGIGFWQNRLVVGSRPSVLLDPGTGKVIEAIPGTYIYNGRPLRTFGTRSEPKITSVLSHQVDHANKDFFLPDRKPVRIEVRSFDRSLAEPTALKAAQAVRALGGRLGDGGYVLKGRVFVGGNGNLDLGQVGFVISGSPPKVPSIEVDWEVVRPDGLGGGSGNSRLRGKFSSRQSFKPGEKIKSFSVSISKEQRQRIIDGLIAKAKSGIPFPNKLRQGAWYRPTRSYD